MKRRGRAAVSAALAALALACSEPAANTDSGSTGGVHAGGSTTAGSTATTPDGGTGENGSGGSSASSGGTRQVTGGVASSTGGSLGGTSGALGGSAGKSAGSSSLGGSGGASGGATGGTPSAGSGSAGAPASGGNGGVNAGGSSAGVASAGGSGGNANGGAAGSGGTAGAAEDRGKRKLLLRDEGLTKLHYIDLGNSAASWSVSVPAGRDLQLVGNGRALIGTETGYEERSIANGAKAFELTAFAGTLSAHRLRSGNTLLVGVNWQSASGIVLVEVNGAGAVQRKIVYPGFGYVRLVRETARGTFLVTANHTVFEGRADGSIVWQHDVNTTLTDTNIWKALELSSGEVVVSAGYAANLQIFGSNHAVRATITGPASVSPYFFSDLQVLPNGNFLVANWEGHGAGNGTKGDQVLEYSPQGSLVWSWHQDANIISSLQAAIVLDGLDLSRLHVEDGSGKLAPLPPG